MHFWKWIVAQSHNTNLKDRMKGIIMKRKGKLLPLCTYNAYIFSDKTVNKLLIKLLFSLTLATVDLSHTHEELSYTQG